MRFKFRKVIFLFCAIFPFILIVSILGSPIEFKFLRNSVVICLNRKYFFTDRYKYMHIIGNYKISTEFGDIYLKTGDKIIDHKGYLGRLFNVKNHTIKILDNKLNEFVSIDIYFDDNFCIELTQDINIMGKIFTIEYIFFENNILTFRIKNFPEEIILKDETSIKLINGDGNLFSISIKIINDLMYLEVFDYNKNDFYFSIQKNDISYKSMKIIIDKNWREIIDYE